MATGSSREAEGGRGDPSPPLARTDGFLSKMAQRVWPQATVWCLDEHTKGEHWELRRPGEAVVRLGSYFGLARQSVEALVAAEEAGRKKG